MRRSGQREIFFSIPTTCAKKSDPMKHDKLAAEWVSKYALATEAA